MSYKFGGIYTGEWLNNQKHGVGKMIYKDGKIFSGDWDKDIFLKSEEVEYKDQNGNEYTG